MKYTQGQTTIPVVVALGAISTFFLGWNGWLSSRVIGDGEQSAAILEWQHNMDERQNRFENTVDNQFDTLNKKIDVIAPHVGAYTKNITVATST